MPVMKVKLNATGRGRHRKKSTLTFLDVDRLLQAADIVRRMDPDQLICLDCAAKLRGVHVHTVRVAVERGTLTSYRMCCGKGLGKLFVDKAEVLALPSKDTKRGIKVGVKRLRKRATACDENAEHAWHTSTQSETEHQRSDVR